LAREAFAAAWKRESPLGDEVEPLRVAVHGIRRVHDDLRPPSGADAVYDEAKQPKPETDE
jgi:hypothetical protein